MYICIFLYVVCSSIESSRSDVSYVVAAFRIKNDIPEIAINEW
jgi:hypothetical protein